MWCRLAALRVAHPNVGRAIEVAQFSDDGVARAAKPQRIFDPAHGPLIAVRPNILTRKTLCGLQTHLDSQVRRGARALAAAT